jgi:hypothetical protein
MPARKKKSDTDTWQIEDKSSFTKILDNEVIPEE